MPPRAPSCGDWQRRIYRGSQQLVVNRQETLVLKPKANALLSAPASRLKLTKNILLKSDAAEVGLAFEAVESLMADDLNGCRFIFRQLLKFTFA
jgi:hypothetical protein